MSSEVLSNHAAHDDDHEHEHHHDAGEMKVFGFWIYLMTDCILFASIFAGFAVLSTAYAGGPTPKDLIDLKLVLVETFALLFSSITYGMAMLAMYRGDKGKVLSWLAATFLFGAVFILSLIHI